MLNATPVRIRGKKRNRELVAAAHSQSSNPAKRLRTLKAPKPKKQVVHAMPTLQGLPQELLEMIFLHSMNISLPRASHDLGRKLSSRSVCMNYTMRCFFETVEYRFIVNAKDFKTKPTRDPVIQSEVLACRFFTWNFFLSYVQKAHKTYIERTHPGWAKASVVISDKSYLDKLWPFKSTQIRYLGFAKRFRIPEKLLHGPWTDDKASLLYVLVSFNGEIDWEGSMAGETAKEGLAEAVEAGNEHAVAALSVLLGIQRAITTEMLRHAIVTCGCDLKLLRHLLFNAQILYGDNQQGGLDFHDPTLWKWADGEGGKGELVKDMLKRAEKFDLEFYMKGESDSMSIVPFPYRGEKFDTRTTFNDVGRELLSLLYRNYGRNMRVHTVTGSHTVTGRRIMRLGS